MVGDIIKVDKSRDIALIKTENAGITSLPFDINYSSNNTYVNMPIMTMLVFQTIFVGVNRLFFSTRSNH